jgi:hypothetical protein
MYCASWWLYISKPPKKADVKDDSVYLTAGTPGRGKATGYTGWCAREAAFGNRLGDLENLSLSAHSFWRFGDTLGAMYDAGRDPVEADWESVVLSASRPMQVGTPKRFKSRPIDQSTPTVSIALKMYANGPGQVAEADVEEEDAFDTLTNLSFNLELLREAVEDVDVRAKQQANHQVLEAEVLGDQIHDARILLGKNPGVFIDPDGSAWDAISALYGKQTQLEEGLAAGVYQLI